MSEPAGYAALYDAQPGEPMCFGYGDSKAKCQAAARRQLQIPDNQIGCRLYGSLYWQPLDADQASEVAEMLDAPWLGWGGVP